MTSDHCGNSVSAPCAREAADAAGSRGAMLQGGGGRLAWASAAKHLLH